MPPIVIDLRKTDDERDIVHRAVQALAEGKLVAFPTETVYGLAASALDESAVARLAKIKERDVDHPFALAIKSVDEATDFVPRMSPLARRLARRCWPGPITLVLDDRNPESVSRQLPSSVQKVVSQSGTIGLRVPAHSVILNSLRLMAGPLVLTSANRPNQPDSVTAEQVVAALGNEVDLVIDDGRSKYAQPSSVVRVSDNQLSVIRPGVLAESALKRLSSLIVLFVCTGNTCRSPMAETLMRRRLAERMKCKPQELEDLGVMVISAGIAAMSGGKASSEAVHAMWTFGMDLSQHESQPLTDRLVKFADLILTMTRGHREAVLSQWPEASPRTNLLSRDGLDVSDPIGGTADMYMRCANQIDSQLGQWVEGLNLDELLFSPAASGD